MSNNTNRGRASLESNSNKDTGMSQFDIARSAFFPTGLEPLSYQGRQIKDLYDLRLVVDRIPESEASRVAQWISLMGDQETAQRIRNEPFRLKDIIEECYRKLSDIYNAAEERERELDSGRS